MYAIISSRICERHQLARARIRLTRPISRTLNLQADHIIFGLSTGSRHRPSSKSRLHPDMSPASPAVGITHVVGSVSSSPAARWRRPVSSVVRRQRRHGQLHHHPTDTPGRQWANWPCWASAISPDEARQMTASASSAIAVLHGKRQLFFSAVHRRPVSFDRIAASARKLFLGAGENLIAEIDQFRSGQLRDS